MGHLLVIIIFEKLKTHEIALSQMDRRPKAILIGLAQNILIVRLSIIIMATDTTLQNLDGG